ncbi:hypothetical protein [Variovorax saccharolyticus]|uniref:hypothetical protein n=1 Tax=Variovorax saccharolyticus TaxID=3053516 RepID=UPI002578C55E|nr:hypothetical protein [Variovorax sp. J22R187]MDM0021780.1 hypothetical protein [Variovorax sp. J22R187]
MSSHRRDKECYTVADGKSVRVEQEQPASRISRGCPFVAQPTTWGRRARRLTRMLAPLGRRVPAMVDYDNLWLSPNVIDLYSDMGLEVHRSSIHASPDTPPVHSCERNWEQRYRDGASRLTVFKMRTKRVSGCTKILCDL